MKNLAAALIIGIFGALLFSTARRTSLVYDEVIYAPAGYLYWKTGDFRWNPEHPPLQKLISSIPWLFSKATVPPDLDPTRQDAWRMGYRVFFQNTAAPRSLVFSARIPTVLLSLLLGAFLFFWIKRKAGWEAATFSLGVLAFDPLVIANGALAMNDMFVAFFIFSGSIAFQKWVDKKKQWWWALIAGAFAGAAIVSKFSGLLALPVYLLIYWKARPSFSRRELMNVSGAMFVGFLVVLVCYRFELGTLINALRAGESVHQADGRTGYLLGQIPGASGWFYYPVAMLVKTPVPLLFLWFAALVFALRKPGLPFRLLLLSPVLLFWIAALISRNHFGIRYLLPATPFLAALIGFFYAKLKSKAEKGICWSLLAWLAVGTALTHPHHMASFNGFAGGSTNGYKWLDGSNQDWGQDLPALENLIAAQSLRPTICMGYWGSNEPEAWGIFYQDIFSPAITNSFRKDAVNPVETPSEWLVLSAELTHNPSTKNVYAWLKERTPIAFPGSTLFVYDITNDAEAALRLADIYGAMGRKSLYDRQVARAKLIGTASSK